jgi:hypothetical protein
VLGAHTGTTQAGPGVRGQSELGNGTEGTTGGSGTSGVYGEHTGTSSTFAGFGVAGRAMGINGVGNFGEAAAAGIAVQANNTSSGIGLRAHSTSGTGVMASSGSGSALQVVGTTLVVPPNSGNWTAGQFLVKNGELWYCTTSGAGTASDWVRVSSPFIPLGIPDRVNAGSRLNNGSTRTVDLGIPGGASAAMFNVTVFSTRGSGRLSIIGANRSFSGTFANISWAGRNQVESNTVTSRVDSAGRVKIRATGGSTKLTVDVIGYFA